MQDRLVQLERGPKKERDPTPEEQQDIKVEEERVRVAFQGLLESHRAQNVDDPWASDTGRLLSADFNTLAAKTGTTSVTVDCRTTICVATLAWTDFDHASNGWQHALNYFFRANCRKKIQLPPPADKSASYSAPMIFECDKWKAHGSVPLEKEAKGNR